MESKDPFWWTNGKNHDKNDDHDNEMSLAVVIYFWTVVDHDQMLEKISVGIGNGHSWSIITPNLALDQFSNTLKARICYLSEF